MSSSWPGSEQAEDQNKHTQTPVITDQARPKDLASQPLPLSKGFKQALI